jgi:hypothetical protein
LAIGNIGTSALSGVRLVAFGTDEAMTISTDEWDYINGRLDLLSSKLATFADHVTDLATMLKRARLKDHRGRQIDLDSVESALEQIAFDVRSNQI